MSTASSNPPLNAILYRCRRGMLELDLMLIPFAKACYATLSNDMQKAFQLFLEEPDPKLFAWLMGREAPSLKPYLSLVQKIRDYQP